MEDWPCACPGISKDDSACPQGILVLAFVMVVMGGCWWRVAALDRSESFRNTQIDLRLSQVCLSRPHAGSP